MCNECKKLWELYAETQLECLKRNKTITNTIIIECKKCKQNIFIAAVMEDNNVFIKGDFPYERLKGINNGTISI